MIIFGPDDMMPLANWSFSWRFEVPHCVGARAFLDDVRPLAYSTALLIESALWNAADEILTNPGRVEQVIPVEEAETYNGRGLRALPIDGADRIVVGWGRCYAVETSWRTFCANWQCFCESATEDITVRPVNESWVVCYCRSAFESECFLYARS